jgi:lon-related putative ATP-dependent protease
MAAKFELAAADLRSPCDPAVFAFKDTSEIEPLDEVIGQQRAVEAIRFGLGIDSAGYNIFVTGQEGTGKTTIVKDIVTKHALTLETPDDWCMVNNFKDPYRPKAAALPPGHALRFSKSMQRFIEDLKIRLPREFEGKSYREKLNEIRDRVTGRRQELFEALNDFAREKNLQINRSPEGYQTVPVVDGSPVAPEEFQKLPDEQKSRFEDDAHQVRIELENTLREVTKLNNGMQKEIEQLMQKVALFVVKDRLDIIREDYAKCRDVPAYLEDVEANILENIAGFLKPKDEKTVADEGPFADIRPAFQEYQVNVLVDRKSLQGAPVVYEPNPTYANVFGQVEKRAFMGAVTTDFTMVQAGSLLQANGGFLIMEVEALLSNAPVWEALKRALQNKQLFIEDTSARGGFITTSLRPEPIPLEVKVILLGDYNTFQLLQNFDTKFNKIFKVRADFDHETDRTPQTVQQYARFIARVCTEEKLLPFTPDGVAAIVEYAEKSVADKNKLSLRFGPTTSIIKEADYWARQSNAAAVTEAFVVRAFNAYRFRYNLYEEKMHKACVEGTVMIDVQGSVVGQVNALAVYQVGDFAFGRPSRITAEVYMGQQGLINIEREARLSGKTHDKGVLILSGCLGRTFARQFPLNLSISITFEQSYGGIDGDSASSTELYAILSSLADIPIKQGIAVTGSVNQKGQVQAIGGVNHKIEGFFDLCKDKGLTGEQGVIVPAANVRNLMVKKEVVDAAAAGRFHIFRVATVEEGIEILTGIPAGRPDAEGRFPEGTVYGAAQQKLKTFLQQAYTLKKEFENLY